MQNRVIAILWNFNKSMKHFMASMLSPLIFTCTDIERCIIDYGPVYGFWLFAFEPFNGMLGNYHANQKDIKIELMRRFLDDNLISTFAESDSFLAEQAFDLPILFLWICRCNY